MPRTGTWTGGTRPRYSRRPSGLISEWRQGRCDF
jgi:hypothetical protein